MVHLKVKGQLKVFSLICERFTQAGVVNQCRLVVVYELNITSIAVLHVIKLLVVRY